jgi:poly(A) polymerase
MIYRRLWSRWRRKKAEKGAGRPQYWDNPISEQHISTNALKVLSGLQEAGFAAYLVGGGVRDLLVNKIPKDFDVATNALPEQIRRLFRNSRIIGRRFRIVHVFYRQEIIEVSTFRAQISEPLVADARSARIHNNTFGTVEEDAWRRDFTVNALYYHPKKRQVLDYTGGMSDLQQKLIRIIGDPVQRFHEDPVRLLRAIRLAAKLQFQIHEDTETQLRQLPALLEHVAESRLFDEVLKLFFTGHAHLTYQKLLEYDYFSALFPQISAIMNLPGTEQTRAFIELSMHETDRRYQEQSSLNPGFLFAVLLWPAVQKILQENSQEKFHLRLRHAVDQVLAKQAEVLTIPHRLLIMMRAIWLLQYYLTSPRKSRVYRTLYHRYFRAAIDFLRLRVQSGEPEQKMLSWWEAFRDADAPTRQQMLDKED